jgi:integrase
MTQWLTHIRANVSPKTFEGYTSKIKAGVIPALGRIRLTKLQPITISAAYAEASRRLSPRSVHHTHRVLSEALLQAVRWRLIPRNPCDDVDPPKVEKPEMKVWDVDSIQRALELARLHRVYMPMLLAVMCGLRRGEIVALRWCNIDLDRAQLSVVETAEQTKGQVRLKPPKTGKGRTVALPAMVVSELRTHRRRQAEELLRFGVRLNDDAFVCAREDGKMLQPNSLYHSFTQFLAATDLPRIRFPRSQTQPRDADAQTQRASEDCLRETRTFTCGVDTRHLFACVPQHAGGSRGGD